MTHHTPSANTTDLPAGYRMTELGPLPEEWRVVRLGEIALVHYGKAKPKTTGTVPVIGSGGIYAWVAKPLINFPTLIIGRKGAAGQVWLAEKPCWPSDTTFYLEWRQPVNVKFLHAYFLLNPLSGEHAKTTLPSLQRPDLEEYPIPLPPLPEQRAIAHVLRTVQDAREATARVIAALRDLKRSLMRHLFTYGPVPLGATGRSPLQQTDIGPIPAHWQVVRLGEVVEHQRKTLNPQAFPNEQFEYYSIPAYQASQIPIIEKGSNIRSQKVIVSPGMVLFGKLNPRVPKIWEVKTRTLKRKIASTEFIALMPLMNVITSDYLYYLAWSSHILPKSQEMVSGSTPSRQRIDVKAFLKILVPLPPLDEQRQIARILQTVDRKIEAEEAREEALDDLFRSLLHHLMTAKIRLPADFIAQFANGNTT